MLVNSKHMRSVNKCSGDVSTKTNGLAINTTVQKDWNVSGPKATYLSRESQHQFLHSQPFLAYLCVRASIL